jgi:hypothetical protein
MLVGLISDPSLELTNADLGSARRVERHRLPDLVHLQLLGRLGALLAHGVADGERRARKDLEDNELKEKSRAHWISKARGKIGISFRPLL